MKAKKLRYLAFVIVLLAIIGAIVYIALPHSKPIDKAAGGKKVSTAAPKTAQVASSSQPVKHIFLIVDENKTAGTILGNSAAPYLNQLAKQYAVATNYQAVAHPSLPNYLALTSGSTDGITTDCNPPSAGCIVNVPNIANEIQSSGRTWKEYAESMPSACYMNNAGNYATKHNPFEYYANIVNSTTYCQAHVVPFTQLSVDLNSAATTPNYAFITPNLCNDMHNCPVSTGDAWLQSTVPTILNSPAFRSSPSLLIITWDEGYSGDNHILTIFAGSAAKKSYSSSAAYTHYSVLHTIETLWGLKPLTANDAAAPVMSDMLQVKP